MRPHFYITAVLILFLTACSSTETIKVGGKEKEVPKWVLDPDDESEQAGITYGVGSAKVDDIDIARYQADQSAIRDLIKKLEQRQKNQSTEKTSAKNGVGRREIEIVTRFESEGIVQGIRIIKRFITEDGTWYSQAILDLNRSDANYESELRKEKEITIQAQ